MTWTQSCLFYLCLCDSNQVPLTLGLLAWHLEVEGRTSACTLLTREKKDVAGGGGRWLRLTKWREMVLLQPGSLPEPQRPHFPAALSREQRADTYSAECPSRSASHPLTPCGYYCFGYMRSLRVECLIIGLNPSYKSNFSPLIEESFRWFSRTPGVKWGNLIW